MPEESGRQQQTGIPVGDAARAPRSSCDCNAAGRDLMEGMIERLAFQSRRAKLWGHVRGERILEVGVGTGRNMAYYPAAAKVTAVDASEKALERAKRRARDWGVSVDLRVMDVQQLEFADASFDAAVASFVFCSVTDPVAGLRELARVVRPGGRVYLLEHMRVDHAWVGKAMDLLDLLVASITGERFSRRTVENVERAGLRIEMVERLAWRGLVRLIVARPGCCETTVALTASTDRSSCADHGAPLASEGSAGPSVGQGD